MWSYGEISAASQRCRAAVLSAVLFALASPSFGQSIATLKGRIIDPTGAIVPGATITLREHETGVERHATSDAAGDYQFVFLPVGIYRIEVQSIGLRPELIPRLVVEVGRTIVQDFQLKVDDVAETLDVVADVPLIERSIASARIGRETVQYVSNIYKYYVAYQLAYDERESRKAR